MAGAVLFGSAGTASAATNITCEGAVTPLTPKKPGVDATLEFTCSEEIRGFSVITNKTFDFFGTELEVIGPDGTPQSQSATIQCSGLVPGPGFGCGTVNRNTPTDCEKVTGSAPGPQDFGDPCTNRMDAGDTAKLQVGFPVSPCKRVGQYKPGSDKLRVWLSALHEPLVGAFNDDWTNQDNTVYTRGTFASAPIPLEIVKYNKCGPGKGKKSKKGKGKKATVSASAQAVEVRVW